MLQCMCLKMTLVLKSGRMMDTLAAHRLDCNDLKTESFLIRQDEFSFLR